MSEKEGKMLNKKLRIFLWIPTILAFFSSLVQVFFVLVSSTEYWGVIPFQYICLAITLILIICIWIVRRKAYYVLSGIAFFCTGLNLKHNYHGLEIIYSPLLWAGILLIILPLFNPTNKSNDLYKT